MHTSGLFSHLRLTVYNMLPILPLAAVDTYSNVCHPNDVSQPNLTQTLFLENS